MNDHSDQRPIGFRVLVTVPADAKPPAVLTDFEDYTDFDELVGVGSGDLERVGSWVRLLTHENGPKIRVHMVLTTRGETVTVSPAYVSIDDDVEILDAIQAEVLANLLHEAAEIVRQADAEMLERQS